MFPVLNGEMQPALEMQYATIRPNLVYRGKRYLPLPKGEKEGHDNLLFMLSPSQADTIKELQTDYIRWFLNMYKWYTTDTIFREKIGKKRIMLNVTAQTRRDWSATKFKHPLRYMSYQQRNTMLKQTPNLIVDIGEWTKFYFEYSYKVSVPIIVRNYIKFLAAKLNDAIYAGYTNRILYIPINQWFSGSKNVLGFTRKYLNNPLAIILFAAYRYPELLSALPEMTIILGDSDNDQFLMYHTSDFTKKNFAKIKMRLRTMAGFYWDEESENVLDHQFTPEEEDEESEINNESNPVQYPDPKGIIPQVGPNASKEETEKAAMMSSNRARLINDVKRSLIGGTSAPELSKLTGSEGPTVGKSLPVATSQTSDRDIGKNSPKKIITTKDLIANKPKYLVEGAPLRKDLGNPTLPEISGEGSLDDVTMDDTVYADDEIISIAEDTIPINIDDNGDLDEAVLTAVDETLEELKRSDPDVLLNRDGNLSAKTIAAPVKKKIAMAYMPDRTEAQLKRIDELKATQDKIILQMPKADVIKSKVIRETNLEGVVNTSNPALKTSKYANFDKSYNEQKLQKDIDDAVAILSKASTKVFVVSKTEEDTSDQLNLKKTIIYELRDEYGGKHTIKIDVPIVIDNNYIYINGSKILLGHQQMMMPIVKTGPTDVQIATWYKKMTVRRLGARDTRTDSIKLYMETNAHKFNIIPGNAMNKNIALQYGSTLDIDMYAKSFSSFDIGHSHFILDREALLKKLKTMWPNVEVVNDKENIPVGYNTDRKIVLYVTSDTSLTDLILGRLSDDAKAKIAANTKNSIRKILRTEVKIMDRLIPLVLLLFFFEGFTKVMSKAEILYHVLDKDDDLTTLDRSKFDIVRCADKIIVWERNPIWNTLLMNGLASIDLTLFDFDELDDRETYANILSGFFGNKNMASILMQFYDFMIDPATAEILEDFGYPTDLVSLLLVANKMLADNNFTPINHGSSFRIRSNEIIAQMVYQQVVSAYLNFRRTEYKVAAKKKPDRISVKQLGAIKDLISGSSLSNEASDLNPILTLEKARSVTPKGPTGINKDRAMTLAKRAYDPSMIGILGITTSPDAKVGITRQLTLEPNITSTRGYTKTISKEEIQSLSNVNLLTPAELLSPPGVIHDDGPRTAMSYKQSQYMLPVEGSTPVFFGNKVEAVVPYHMSREFVVAAKDDGEVVEMKNGIIIVKYNDGTFDSIDTNYKMKKNSSGFFVKVRMESQLKEVGQKFKKNEVLAQDPRAFTKDSDDLSASMNIGVPVKIAIVPNYDIYEDAAPITTKLSEKFTTHMSMKSSVGIPAHSYVEKMVDVGDYVKIEDPLIIYDPAHDDENVNNFLEEIRAKLGESLVDIVDVASMPQVRAEYAGRISAIEVYSSVELEELSPSLQAIVKKYTAQSKKAYNLLSKYSNPGDMKYYKCGQLITSAPEVVKPDYANRVKGVKIGDDGRGVVILFYIEFKDIAKAGDKGANYTALKFTTSHVIPEGREPYSEYRPDEEISTFIAPGAILARKTPSIWITAATNKCIVEMKRHALDIFFKDTDGDPEK